MLVRPERFFADRFGLSASVTERLLGGTLARRVDHADLYLEYRVTEELVLEEGAVKKASRHVSQGAGVRAQSGERTGYAHTDDLALPNLEEAVRQARAIADGAGESAVVPVVTEARPHDLYTLAEPPLAADVHAKVALLRSIDAAARAADPRVRQVIASLGSEDVVVLIAGPSGWTTGDIRPLTRLNVTVIAEDNGKREIGSFGGGGRVGFAFFHENERWRRFAGEAVRQAVLKLGAVDAPAGTMTVVLGPGLARHPAPRGGGPRPRGRLQPQGYLGLRGPARPEGRVRAGHRGRRRHHREPARLAQRGRRGRAHATQRAHREGHPARLHAGPSQRAADAAWSPPATAAASRTPIRRCRA